MTFLHLLFKSERVAKLTNVKEKICLWNPREIVRVFCRDLSKDVKNFQMLKFRTFYFPTLFTSFRTNFRQKVWTHTETYMEPKANLRLQSMNYTEPTYRWRVKMMVTLHPRGFRIRRHENKTKHSIKPLHISSSISSRVCSMKETKSFGAT